jgi:hypothetical protein
MMIRLLRYLLFCYLYTYNTYTRYPLTCLYRLTINSFVECLMNMAEFKFPDAEPGSAAAMRGLVESTGLGPLLAEPARLRGLQDLFIDFCHPGVFDSFAQNQVLLLKAYKRSANYGIRSTFSPPAQPAAAVAGSRGSPGKAGGGKAPCGDRAKADPPMSVVQSFNQFCATHMIVPVMTRESVVARISIYLRCALC